MGQALWTNEQRGRTGGQSPWLSCLTGSGLGAPASAWLTGLRQPVQAFWLAPPQVWVEPPDFSEEGFEESTVGRKWASQN